MPHYHEISKKKQNCREDRCNLRNSVLAEFHIVLLDHQVCHRQHHWGVASGMRINAHDQLFFSIEGSSLLKALLKRYFFLFPRWDMLAPRRIGTFLGTQVTVEDAPIIGVFSTGAPKHLQCTRMWMSRPKTQRVLQMELLHKVSNHVTSAFKCLTKMVKNFNGPSLKRKTFKNGHTGDAPEI